MLSFDADPRTRLVVCCAAMAAAAIIAPMFGKWWYIVLFAAPAMLGYFAARMDWPLFAAGIGLTPLLVGSLVGVMGAADLPGRPEAGIWMLVAPPVGMILLVSGAVGAWAGDRTHGGDWRPEPLIDRVMVACAIAGVVFGVSVVLAERVRCTAPGYDGAVACQQASAAALAAGAVLGAVALRSWVWPAMATAGIALVLSIRAVVGGGSLLDVAVMSACAGMIALAAVAWARFAMEAAAMLRQGAAVRRGAEDRAG